MIIDSHCHLDRINLDRYEDKLSNALDSARERGVDGFLCISISLENLQNVVDIAQAERNVWASVGVHPLDVESGTADVAALQTFAAQDKVVAIGETGLDYYYSQDSKTLQQESFAAHLQAAGAVDLPVVVHTRDAREDTLSLIKSEGKQDSSGVLHCFTEDWDMARRALDMNYMISISGIVTFKNADALRDVVRKMPLDRLLVETDSPYLAPVPYRGKPNQPKYVREVAEYVAELKGLSVEELGEITSANFFKLFNRAKLQA
jgi:TatD DNase family protein